MTYYKLLLYVSPLALICCVSQLSCTHTLALSHEAIIKGCKGTLEANKHPNVSPH